MKGFFQKLREGEQMLNIAGLTAAVMFLLAGPCWSLYAWAMDLGPGGWGGLAQPDTPAASSVAEMEGLERFTLRLQGTADEYPRLEYFFVDGVTYWVFPLDSGEQVAGRFTLENVQREKRDGIYQECYPVGAWREWDLTPEERAAVERDAPGLSTTGHYVDMVGRHRENITEARFKAGFWTLCLLAGLISILFTGFHQDRQKRKEADTTLPRDDLERWIVGIYAIWGQFFAQLGRRPDGRRDVEARRGPIRIGGQPMDDRGQKFTRETLEDSWEITSRQELYETVDYMSAGPGLHKCETQADRAWQLCRSMQLLGMGFTADWYSRKEMVERSCQVGQVIQRHFRSWEELCEGFLEGFYTWRLGAYGPEDAQAALRERREIYRELRARPDSPYRLNWYFPMDPERRLRQEKQLSQLEK